MKKAVFGLLILSACAKQQVHPPVGGILSEKDLNASRNRAKNLNQMERSQIEQWISQQDKTFYPMGLNYWTDSKNLKERPRKEDGLAVSYSYEIFDFDNEKLSEKPTVVENGVLGKFEELKAIDDAVRYMLPGEETVLLVPSVLAFGTYGDNNKISNDMPLIIKLKTLK